MCEVGNNFVPGYKLDLDLNNVAQEPVLLILLNGFFLHCSHSPENITIDILVFVHLAFLLWLHTETKT